MKAPKSAMGMKGCLISLFTGGVAFRVYDKSNPEKFIDYDLAHNDLNITIEDEDAYIYEREDSDPAIDYSPRTLGRE